jgi:serine/threonine protein kinase
MDHPFIAFFFEALDDANYYYFVIELVERGSLLNFINANRGLREEQARRIFYQLITVLDYLHHERRVVHRDLKAENVLLDVNYNIRLVDFGLSKAFTRDNPFLQTTCGSPGYVAPEVIAERGYTAAADIWSAGVLLYAMVVAALPFTGHDLSTLLNDIITASPVIPMHLSPELRDLIQRLLVKDPDHRITTQGIIDHPWLVEFEKSDVATVDETFIKALKVQEVSELDERVIGEMRVLGYDTSDLATEVVRNQINSRTAAYKMLRRGFILQEIKDWQDQRAKTLLEIKSTTGSSANSPRADRSENTEFRSTAPAPNPTHHAAAGMIRKRVVAPKVPHPSVKLSDLK